MNLQIDDRVRSPSCLDWGIGRVLEIKGKKKRRARVFFTRVGEKSIVLETGDLEIVAGPEAIDSRLDNLSRRKGKDPFRSFDVLQRRFEKRYPGGFASEHYLEEVRERQFGVAALAREKLERRALVEALRDGRIDEVVEAAHVVFSIADVAKRNERAALALGFEDELHRGRFAGAIVEALHGEAGLVERFDRLCDALRQMDALTWRIATVWNAALDPSRHLIVRPRLTKRIADTCRFEIGYRPVPGGGTYARVLRFADWLQRELEPAGARDMIDVQSFIWTVAKGH